MDPRSNAIAIVKTGFASSVGLSSPAACAAIRAGVRNPTETRFLGSSGEWLMAHQVPLDQPWRGRARLVKMAALALDEALAGIARPEWARIPLLLCVAERNRPGRTEGLEVDLLHEVQQELGAVFSPDSLVVPQGRVAAAVALRRARHLVDEDGVAQVVIAGADSLLSWRTLRTYVQQERLLTSTNSDGFMPGEGAAALLVGHASGPVLKCTGLGFAHEPAPLDSGEPLRGEGLSRAIRDALREAERELQDMQLRITDVAGEHYYFKEAALGLARAGRVRKEQMDLWHPAECIGESGAVAGLAAIVVADAASRKTLGAGSCLLLHAANDDGRRAAAVFEYQG